MLFKVYLFPFVISIIYIFSRDFISLETFPYSVPTICIYTILDIPKNCREADISQGPKTGSKSPQDSGRDCCGD